MTSGRTRRLDNVLSDKIAGPSSLTRKDVRHSRKGRETEKCVQFHRTETLLGHLSSRFATTIYLAAYIPIGCISRRGERAQFDTVQQANLDNRRMSKKKKCKTRGILQNYQYIE